MPMMNLIMFFNKKGNKRQLTMIYTPQQNGVAQQMNINSVRNNNSNIEECKPRKAMIG